MNAIERKVRDYIYDMWNFNPQVEQLASNLFEVSIYNTQAWGDEVASNELQWGEMHADIRESYEISWVSDTVSGRTQDEFGEYFTTSCRLRFSDLSIVD